MFLAWSRDRKQNPLLGKVRRVLGSRGDMREQGGLTDVELNKFLIDDQNLPLLECERVGVLARKTTVLVVPHCLVPDLLALVHCQHGHPGVTRTLSLLRDRFHCLIGIREITCCHAGADAASGHVAST